ncbi:MAG: hypothetical protein ACKV0T_30095 [Planctomycetales bacterium]
MAVLAGMLLGYRASGGEHHTLRFAYGNAGNVATATCIAISPRSDELLFGTTFGKVQFIRVRDGEMLQFVNGTGESAAYSADASRALIKTERRWVLLELPARRETAVFDDYVPGMLGITLSQRNGKLLVTELIPDGPGAQSGKIQVGDEVTSYATGLLGPKTSLIGISVKAATEQLIGLPNTTVRISLIPKGEEDETEVVLRRRGFHSRGTSGEFVDEPAQGRDNVVPAIVQGGLAFASARTGRIFAGPTPETVIEDRQRAVSHDFKRYAILGPTKEGSKKFALELFDLETMKRVNSAPFPLASFFALRFSPDGKLLFVASQVRVDAFDSQSGQFSHGYLLDGRRSETIEDVNLVASENKGSFNPNASALQSAREQLAFGPDVPKPQARVMAVSRDFLATADDGGNAVLWRLDTGAEVKRFSTKERKRVEILEFTPDGRWLIFYRQGTLHIVEVADLVPPGSDADAKSPSPKPR